MFKVTTVVFTILIVFLTACTQEKKRELKTKTTVVISESKPLIDKDTLIVDCNYSFDSAVSGSNAPQKIIDQLQLLDVQYYSIDKKLHQGQILTNKLLANDISELFKYILEIHFPIAKAIPIVKYNWNDNLSMQDNNTYSFCYRNISYSKHATGMAIDINPYFNPLRWKNDSIPRPNKPNGATYDTSVQGTFYPNHPVILKSKSLGFRWGHYFRKKFDDHHFEK
ncbi:MAG: M15 family metallopeptidase [Paludibacter sp.]|nr:M15 family metallopeptidase [Paludibacter sp.]